MLDGWYCRSMANQQSNNEDESEDENQIAQVNPRVDYKGQYNNLKKKLKFLLYENEFFQDALRSSQRRLLKCTRDRSFLLDRLLQYEKPEQTSTESEDTESSDDDSKAEPPKKRKLDSITGANASSYNSGKNQNAPKRKKTTVKKMMGNIPNTDGHMTAEEVERHLQSRQSLMELVPERAPPTVPNEMFSNEPSLDSESNDQMIETSPSNLGEECLSVDYKDIIQ